MNSTIEIPPSGVRETIDALLQKHRAHATNALGNARSVRLCDVGARMASVLQSVACQHGKTVGSDQVAKINDLLRDWDEAIATARAVMTWRARIGRGEDFPLHAANDVERAMEEQIAELRAQVVPADTTAGVGGAE